MDKMAERKIRKNVLTKRRNYFGSIRDQLKNAMEVEGELTCAVCGCKDSLELHHIIPLSMNGSNDIDNLVPLCHDHHVEIHHENSDLIQKEGKEMEY